MTDTEFLEAFESCSLPEAQWTHEAHVRMAWLYLQKMPLSEAIAVVRLGIKRYNASLKKSLAYHETITQVFLILISDRMQRSSEAQSFADFCNENPDLLDRNMTALLNYYRKETLFSQAARDGFVEPDLAILPNTPARF
ncbi:MAG: hypothetical protein WCH39_16075 [Schlesneria sp.]